MTIEQKAREIVESVKALGGGQYHEAEKAARLGIIEGLGMAEQAVSQALAFGAREAAVRAIRALIEEQK